MNLDDDDFDYVDELPARPRRTIPEADRELLELAARALGAVRVEDVDGEEWLILHFADGAIRHGWNPLIHSDDALILAAQLRIDIDWTDDTVVLADYSCPEPVGDDPTTAVRRAITRAAAEIGKTMK